MLKKIAVIGGGASGVLAALHCWKVVGKKIQIFIFDPAPVLGRGKAYAGACSDYLLNVPANNMGVFAENGEEFEQWVLKFNPDIQHTREWPFVPRYYFGLYLEDYLKQIPSEHIIHIHKKVESISHSDDSYFLQLDDGTHFQFDYVIIATGYRTPIIPHSARATSLQHKIFYPENLEPLLPDSFSGNIFIIGTGLTAIDVWRKLNKNKKLTFTFLSRKGLFPCRQDFSKPTITLPKLYRKSPLEIFQMLRSLQKQNKASWAVLANLLRKQAQRIWTSWSEKEKSIFLRYLKPYWELIRHRTPDTVFDDLQNDFKTKHAEIRSGKIFSIKESNERFLITYKDRATKKIKEFNADFIVYAIGSPISQELSFEKNMLGIKVCSNGLGYLNETIERLWIIGPSSRGMVWESIAVPEIREQAKDIAEALKVSEKIALP